VVVFISGVVVLPGKVVVFVSAGLPVVVSEGLVVNSEDVVRLWQPIQLESKTRRMSTVNDFLSIFRTGYTD
jgi:hypothetical protein